MLRRRLLFLLMPVLVTAFPAQASEETFVRVGIYLNQNQVTVRLQASAEALDPFAQAAVILPPGTYQVMPRPGGIDVSTSGDAGVYGFGGTVRISSTEPIQVESRRYRGGVEIRLTPGGLLTVINGLGLEEYLRGVLKMEVDPRWPVETLKAQAVAARTIAVQSLGRFAAEGYDLRATTDSQVYGGVNAEDPRTTAAVEATRGAILTFGGRPIFAAYHSDSGGMTEASELVWGRVYPYLRGVPDPFGQDSPVREWMVRLPLSALEERFQRAGRLVRNVSSVEVVRTSPSGRVLAVRISGDHGVVELRGSELRSILGLRSTLFTIRPGTAAGEVEIQGRGAGHGVGMSQWGARGQGLMGRSYEQILRHYYQGVQLEEQ